MLLFASDMRAPQDALNTLRDKCPVARQEFLGNTTVYISRHEDVRWAMRHPEYFTSETTMDLGEQPLIPLQGHPPRHAQHRPLLNPALVPATIDGRQLDETELLGIAHLLMLGGLDTVTATLDCMITYLANHPARRAALIDDPSRIPAVIEELLRWETPVMIVPRAVKQD